VRRGVQLVCLSLQEVRRLFTRLIQAWQPSNAYILGATQEDCIEAILRQMPHVLTFARNLKHRDVVADPAFQRERLSALTPSAFERVSGACTSDLLALLYSWDRQSGKQ
jgi:hypothetical protein